MFKNPRCDSMILYRKIIIGKCTYRYMIDLHIKNEFTVDI